MKLTFKCRDPGELRIRNDENLCVPAVLGERKNRKNFVAGQARNAVTITQVSSIERFDSCRQVREQNVASKVEGNCVIPNKTSVPDIVDFDPAKIKAKSIKEI